MLRILLVILGMVTANPVMADDSARFNVLYGDLLGQYWHPTVTIHGIETTVFDYGAMQNKAGPLMDKISAALETIDPTALGDDNNTKAFWINVYNFTAMRMVVDAYPVDSITSFKISLIKRPWSKKSVQVGNQSYSLTEIEKEILLKKFNDPRIIFAISCAAVSCPDRQAVIFDGERLEEQLDDHIKTFFRNLGKGLFLNRENNTLTLAWILKKDGHLFQGDEEGVLAFVLPYLDKWQQDWLATQQPTIDYFEHDWTLNDLAQADVSK